jgi:signal transduction histidine kinase
MTTTTRRISEHNLHERLALAGPDDELKDLADTIDGLLARLESAFDSRRRFIANASHELRTPLMLSQTLLQVALANPGITLDSLRAACQEVIDAGKDPPPSAACAGGRAARHGRGRADCRGAPGVGRGARARRTRRRGSRAAGRCP